jgi:hypothetical protein
MPVTPLAYVQLRSSALRRHMLGVEFVSRILMMETVFEALISLKWLMQQSAEEAWYYFTHTKTHTQT